MRGLEIIDSFSGMLQSTKSPQATSPYFTEMRWHLELCPYLEIPVSFDYGSCFNEALALMDEFVPHRNYRKTKNLEPQWKSLCLRGLEGDPKKTLYHTDYRVKRPVFMQTPIADSCPKTMEFLKSFTDLEQCGRIRFMLLEPGARIHVHRDQADGELAIGINIALNNPVGCEFFIETDQSGRHTPWTQEIPFTSGSAMIINVGKFHYVENNSSEPRIHIIIDGPIRFQEEELVRFARNQNKVHNFKELTQEVILKRAQQQIPAKNSSQFIDFWKTQGMDREIMAREFDLLILEPDHFVDSTNAVELQNMTLAGTFPLHCQILSKSKLDAFLSQSLPKKAQVILASGTFIPDTYTFTYETLRMISTMRSVNSFLAGHILDFKNQLPELHEQMTILDLTQDIGPKLGQFQIPSSFYNFRGYRRSKENFHDNYTPHWIEGVPEDDSILGKPGWGTDLISKSLKDGFRVLALNEDLRSTKHYSYPQKKNSPELKDVRKKIQNLFNLAKDKVYYFNNEPLNLVSIENFKPSCLYSVAAGFKPSAILEQYWKDRTPQKIVFLDYSNRTLDFISDLGQIDSFEKLKYFIGARTKKEKTYRQLSEDEISSHLKSVVDEAFNGQQELFIKTLKKISLAHFKTADFVSEPDMFTQSLDKNESFIFWHSNAWFNNTLYYIKSPIRLKQEYLKFGQSLGRALNCKVWVHKHYFELVLGNSQNEIRGLVTSGCNQGALDWSKYEEIYSQEKSMKLDSQNITI